MLWAGSGGHFSHLLPAGVPYGADLLLVTWAFMTTGGLVLLVLLLLSALISGSEVAFFSIAPAEIINLKASSEPAEKRIVRLLRHPNRLLATILIFNNFVNIAFVTLATSMALAYFSADGTTDAHTATIITYLTGVVTFLLVFFGEVTPKVYAAQNNLAFARATSGVIRAADVLFYPIALVLMQMGSFLDQRMARKGYSLSVDELNHALDITSNEDTTAEERDILKGIVNFGTISVRQIMRTRMDITALDIEIDFHQLLDKINKSGYSRIPVYKETIDHIVGVLYVKDLLAYIDESEHFAWQKLLRSCYFVPENKKIDDLMRSFQEMRVHVAVVVDEYGGTSGLVTLEDIIEEIVGDINDEFDDDEDVIYTRIDDRTYVFEGKTSLMDFCKVVNVDPALFEKARGESESLGGLLLELTAKMPRAGEVIRYNDFAFQIVSVNARRIKRVKVQILQQDVPQKNT